RPMLRIVQPLQQMGVAITASAEGGAPLRLEGRPAGMLLTPLHYNLPVASAQVKTCLLLASLAASAPSVVSEPLLSRDHSERLLSAMGVKIEQKFSGRAHSVRITPPSNGALEPIHAVIPGDFSAAAFLIVASLIVPGSHILIQNVGLNPTRTGLLDALLEMGANIQIHNVQTLSGEPVGNIEVRHSPLKGIDVSGERVVSMIDEFPIFAVAAAFAHGVTTVTGAEELRYKESDRIGDLCREFKKVGIVIHENPDGFIIESNGNVPGNGIVQPYADHRLAMSMMVMGLASKKPITVQDVQIISESFPDFLSILQSLGADVLD
ncbi:MAG: 3-phosphoshikimate 1-carboxyvinyltransferase, partial [Anaerolineales bacterium]